MNAESIPDLVYCHRILYTFDSLVDRHSLCLQCIWFHPLLGTMRGLSSYCQQFLPVPTYICIGGLQELLDRWYLIRE